MSGCVEADDEADDAAESSPFEDRCDVLCDASGTVCDLEDQTWCETHCMVRTEILPFTCGVCIIDNSRGYGSSCADPDLARVSDPECLAACADLPEQEVSWEDRCLLMCTASGSSICEGVDDGRCYDECLVHTSGLSTPCAMCLLDGSYYPTSSCDPHLAPISEEACASYCAAG